MRNVAAAIVTLFIVSTAVTASAAAKKPAKGFDDLFSAVDKAGKSKSAKPSHAAKPTKAAPVAKAAAHKAGPLVASAAPAPAPVPDNQLVLRDYAPDRHAWAGP